MLTALAELVGPANVEERPVEDLWPLGLMLRRVGPAPGSAVVVSPGTVQEVAAVVGWAARNRIRLTPLGGGSGVCGAIVDTAGEVLLDLSRLDSIEIDGRDLIVRAQSGVVGQVLEEALNASRLTLGHFPSSLPVASLGGLVATRSSGQESTYYGNIEDLVLGLGVVLPDGTYVAPRAPARSAVGPALHDLFLGAEGALGVVVEVVLRVRRLPPAAAGRGYCFATLGAGLAAMREVMQRDLRPRVMRLYDAEDTAFQGSAAEGCLLVVAVQGEHEMVTAQWQVLERLLEAGTDLGPEPWQEWAANRFRLSAERLRHSLEAPGSFLDTIEVAAPWSNLEALHSEIKAELAVEGIALCHFSHATPQGCCAYFTFAGSAGDEAAAQSAYGRCWDAAMRACAGHGATIGHHHGAGTVRAPWLEQEMGEWLEVWKAIRSALDRPGVMSPRALGGRR